jgi:hypothetical protein
MKTQAIYLQNTGSKRKEISALLKLDTTSARKVIMLVLSALLPALLVTVVSIWAISTGALAYVSASFWAIGFIFLALMVDAEDGRFKLFGYTGLVMMVLAWMSWNVAPEFGVLAGFLLSAWVSGMVLNRVGQLTPEPA